MSQGLEDRRLGRTASSACVEPSGSRSPGDVDGLPAADDEVVEVFVWNARLGAYVFVPEERGVEDGIGRLDDARVQEHVIGASVSLDSSLVSPGTPLDRILPPCATLPYAFPSSSSLLPPLEDFPPLLLSPDPPIPAPADPYASTLPIIVEEERSWLEYYGGVGDTLSMSSVGVLWIVHMAVFCSILDF